MSAIVGYTGFVGLNLQQFYKFDYFYNSKNFLEAKNKSFDIIFFCGVPAVKWYANKNPENDFNTLENIKSVLDYVETKKIILISTIDVYENVSSGVDEDYKINYYKNHTYGKNRFLFEEYIKNRFNNYNIIRLPALFGKGLKKNIIYDLIHDNNVNNIKINSYFQWYFLDWLKDDIDLILKNNIKVCNLFTEPLSSKKIIEIFKEIYNIDYLFKIDHCSDEHHIIKYNVCTKYNNYFGYEDKYIRDKYKVIEGIKKFLLFEKFDKSNLCVSNICINEISQIQFACILKLFGINNIQIAPTKLIKTWDNIEQLDLSIYKKLNLNVYSFQSILYNLNTLNIFNEDTSGTLYNHLIKIIDYAEKNNVKILVFGCPRNRKVLDKKLDNNKIFIDFFEKIGEYLYGKNVIICIENNSKKYNCNFINTIEECSNIVRKINKPNIKMMVDLGNAVMENDYWYYLKRHIDIIYNIDISQQYMKDFSEIHESNEIFNIVLKKNNYDKIINLEMLIKSNNEINSLKLSLINFIYLYNKSI
jgi:sugar phosphate isomerase/epimerase/nucleoside-diphosphate-sugar epimerase